MLTPDTTATRITKKTRRKNQVKLKRLGEKREKNAEENMQSVFGRHKQKPRRIILSLLTTVPVAAVVAALAAIPAEVQP